MLLGLPQSINMSQFILNYCVHILLNVKSRVNLRSLKVHHEPETQPSLKQLDN